jgi:hypothetical protein
VVNSKPIFALDFQKGKWIKSAWPAMPSRAYEKVTFPLKALLMFYVFLKSHNLNLFLPPPNRNPRVSIDNVTCSPEASGGHGGLTNSYGK